MTVGYVTLGALDLEGSLPFYDAVLGAAGYARGPVDGRWAFYTKAGAPSLGICTPYDGKPACGGNGTMIGFSVDDKAQVEAVYAAALAKGATDEGAPGFRPPEATSGFYGGYVRDATGNKLCFYTRL